MMQVNNAVFNLILKQAVNIHSSDNLGAFSGSGGKSSIHTPHASFMDATMAGAMGKRPFGVNQQLNGTPVYDKLYLLYVRVQLSQYCLRLRF